MFSSVAPQLADELGQIRDQGLFKTERVIASPQRASIEVAGAQVLNLCANNYLGLSDDPRIVEAAKAALDRWGFGMSSVRFICGTQDIHKQLEHRLSAFLGTADTILYPSCCDANGGLFETILSDQDAVISDEVAPADRRQVTTRVVFGHPAEVLLEAAAGADLLVIGSRGHGSFADALLGSVGQYCVHHAHCPVLIMRGEPHHAAA